MRRGFLQRNANCNDARFNTKHRQQGSAERGLIACLCFVCLLLVFDEIHCVWASLQILHHSVDWLIGTTRHKNVSKSSHKFGFSNPEEFENAIKFISNVFREFMLETITEAQLLSHFSHLNPDFQHSVMDVVITRRAEMEEFLISEHNARINDLVTSFDWDLRWILGTNNFTTLRKQIVTLILNCKTVKSTELKRIYMEMDRTKLDRLIDILEECDKTLNVN